MHRPWVFFQAFLSWVHQQNILHFSICKASGVVSMRVFQVKLDHPSVSSWIRVIHIAVPKTLQHKNSPDFQVLIFWPNIDESSFITDRTDPDVSLYFYTHTNTYLLLPKKPKYLSSFFTALWAKPASQLLPSKCWSFPMHNVKMSMNLLLLVAQHNFGFPALQGVLFL